MNNSNFVIIDGPWASGKSIAKGILDGHPDCVSCLHQEPIISATVEYNKDLQELSHELAVNKFLKRLKMDELKKSFEERSIWWWMGEEDRVVLSFNNDPKIIQDEFSFLLSSARLLTMEEALACYRKAIFLTRRQKGSDSIKLIIMEDFMRSSDTIQNCLKINNIKIIIILRNPFNISKDICLRRDKFLNPLQRLKAAAVFMKMLFESTMYYFRWIVNSFFNKSIMFASFETLKNGNQSEILRISKFLEIKIDPIMFKCTYDEVEIKSEKGIQYMRD